MAVRAAMPCVVALCAGMGAALWHAHITIRHRRIEPPGKYVPAIAYKIHTENAALEGDGAARLPGGFTKQVIKLKGLIIGDGLAKFGQARHRCVLIVSGIQRCDRELWREDISLWLRSARPQ